MVEDGFMWQGQGYACTLRHLGPLTKGLLHPDSSAVYFFFIFLFLVIPSEGLSLFQLLCERHCFCWSSLLFHCDQLLIVSVLGNVAN